MNSIGRTQPEKHRPCSGISLGSVVFYYVTDREKVLPPAGQLVFAVLRFSNQFAMRDLTPVASITEWRSASVSPSPSRAQPALPSSLKTSGQRHIRDAPPSGWCRSVRNCAGPQDLKGDRQKRARDGNPHLNQRLETFTNGLGWKSHGPGSEEVSNSRMED